MLFKVSALGTEALETLEIEADSIDQAIEIYKEKWENGDAPGLDYEFHHFTVTDQNGHDHRVNENPFLVEKTCRDNEYAAWQRLVEMLKEKGIDINKEDDLTACLKDWAAFVHQLKLARGV